MAEEDEEESGGGGIMKVIVPVVALILGVGGGFMIGNNMGIQNVEETQTMQPAADTGDQSRDPNSMVGDMYKLDPFVVNLSEPKGSRYLKTTIQLEMEDKPDLNAELERRSAQMRDVILALLTSKSSHDLQALEGKFRLREELLSRINALLVNGTVIRVYFTEFVIQ